MIPIQIDRRIALVLVALFVVGLCFIDASAQQRRRRRQSRRLTNPVVSTRTTTQPGTTTTTTTTNTTADPRIISTADANDQGDQPNTRRTRRTRTTTLDEDHDAMRRTVDNLSNKVGQLTDEISQMKQQQRTLVDLDRLTRAEQRAESLRKQLFEVQEKEANLQARLDQVESDLRPENIERSAATYGSTRPEDVRADRRRQLENERTRIQSQLTLLGTSRARLEAAVASADAEVDTLRARLDAPSAAATTTTTTTGTETTPQPQPTTPAHGPTTDTDNSPSSTPR
jgi:regulator of replication initiation timing